MTAKEALELSNISKLPQIYLKIIQAVCNGETDIRIEPYEMTIPDQDKLYLRDKGYTVDDYGHCVKIRWS